MLLSDLRRPRREQPETFVRNPKMSLVITLLFLAIPCACNSKSEKFVVLDCKHEYDGFNGQESLLECIVTSTGNDVTIIGVNWKKMGKDLLDYYKGKTIVSPGFQFAVPGWNNKTSNVSLLLTNTKMADTGEYECEVQTDSGDDKKKVSLNVTAVYTTPITNSSPENNTEGNTTVTIYCNSTDRAPKKMIWWFDEDSKNLTDSANLVVKKKDNGLFCISSKLTVRKDISKHYTCKVLSITGVQEKMESFDFHSETSPPKEDPSVTQWVAPVVVIGSLIVGLLVALLICRRRSQQRARRHSTIALINPGGRSVGMVDSNATEREGLNV